MEKDIDKIKSKILKLGPFLPGSLSMQWNVCGKKDCACKEPEHGIIEINRYKFSIKFKFFI